MKKICQDIQNLDINELRELIAELNECALKETNLSKRFKAFRQAKYYTQIATAIEHIDIMTRGF